MNVVQPAHSKLGASSYDRWGKSLGGCPGSVRLSEGVKKTTSVYAEAGTKAHEVAYLMLSGKPYAELEDPEEQAAVEQYVEYVEGVGGHPPQITRKLEQRFDLCEYYPGLFGTADCVFYYPHVKKLVVIDYKHGAGIPVEVEENPQLMYYGLGALNALKVPVETVKLVIVQPRCFHKDGPIRSWETDVIRMLDFVADLIEDAKATEDPNAELVTGDHCRWCPAQASCPALSEKALILAKQTFTPADSYDPQKLATTLAALNAIESWAKSVREFAYREALHGRVPPGWKLVEKRATRKWKPEVDPDYINAKIGLKPHETTEQKMKSPAQLEKFLQHSLGDRMRLVKAQATKSGAPNEEAQQKLIWDKFNECIVKESSGTALVPEEDGRPALKLDAKDVFDVIGD